jgi:Cft2 family RNA processing exonuclease
MSITFTNLTRQNEIGANCYHLDFNGKGLLLDAGMHPKHDGRAALPNFDPTQGRNISAIFVSHAHHDHIGALPIAAQWHPDARIFMGDATYFLGDHLLHNSVNVMKRQREELQILEYPLYTHPDLNKLVQRWQACHIGKRWSLEGHESDRPEDVSFKFYRAGHILGSVGIEIESAGQKIFYTGDVNFSNQSVMRAAQFPERDIDTLIIESTRGTQSTHESRPQTVENLLKAIQDTFDRDGAVMIPVFAMGKMQEVLTILYRAQEKKLIEKGPIFISGLGKIFSQVYDRMVTAGECQSPYVSLMDHVHPEIMSGARAAQMKPKRGHIYLISSGMMTEHTLSNLFAQKMLARERDSILFVGYTDPESPAGKLRATPRGQRVLINKEYGDQPVLCNVQYFDLTAHAQRDDLLAFTQHLKPRKCLLVHGDLKAMHWFQEQLAPSGIDVIIPEPGRQIELSS